MRRCVRHSKKRTQASPDQAGGDPTRAQRPVRVEDGRDPGPLRRALRSEQTSSLLRREALSVAGRCEGPSADATGRAAQPVILLLLLLLPSSGALGLGEALLQSPDPLASRLERTTCRSEISSLKT